MKVTRYFQSCLLIEEDKARILIDPSAMDAENYDKFKKVDAVIYTHEHGDHFDIDLAEKFAGEGIKIYANAATAKLMKTQPQIVANGQEFDVNGVKVQAKELPHCLMWDGSAGPQNTGYVFNTWFFHPGDGKELAGLTVEALALPISGPDISLMDALNFAKQVSAKTIIPIHYDYLGGNTKVVADIGKGMGLDFHVLGNGESVSI